MKLSLLVLSVLLCNALISQTITFTGPPSFCAGGSKILATSTGTALAWDFSANGNPPWTNIGTSINITATQAGTYRIGSVSPPPVYYDSVVLSINPNPVASFSFSPNNQCMSEPVFFTNSSSGATTYQWNFGDPASGGNNTSTAANKLMCGVGSG